MNQRSKQTTYPQYNPTFKPPYKHQFQIVSGKRETSNMSSIFVFSAGPASAAEYVWRLVHFSSSQMMICDLCRSIPLHDKLPTLPPDLWGGQESWRYIHQFHVDSATENPCGFPYHSSVESLQLSAELCDLCHLILQSVDKAIEGLRNPHPDKWEPMDMLQKGSWNMWLMKRQELLGEAFCVFTNWRIATVSVSLQQLVSV